MERRVEALRKSGTPVEYHEYEGLGHGFGLGTDECRGMGLRSHPVLGDVDRRTGWRREVILKKRSRDRAGLEVSEIGYGCMGLTGATHIDLYDRPRFVTPAAGKLADFFGRHLADARGSK